jgi:hypothetical protein
MVTISSIEPRDEMRSFLARVRRRWVTRTRLGAAGLSMAAGAIPIVLALLVVHAGNVEGLPLLALTMVTLILAAASASVPMFRMPRRPSDRQVARYIEERIAILTGDASLNDSLVSALDVAESTATPGSAFGPVILAAASRHLSATEPAGIVTTHSMRTAAWSAAAGGVFLAMALTAGAPAAGRAADAARVTFFPGEVRIDVLPGNVRMAAGAPLRVRTIVRTGRRPLRQLTPLLTLTSGSEQRSVAMTPVGDAFEYSIAAIDRSFSYRVTAGPARSSDYTVTALSPPRVTRIDLRYFYPAFAGLAPREEQDAGDIYAPAGTRVRLRIQTDKAVTRGALTFAAGPAIAVRPAADGSVEADVILTEDDSYRVQLADEDGLQSRGDSEYFIRLMNDRPPDVRILRPSADQQITPLEEIVVEARADDDYGISAFDLVYAVGGGAERTLQFKRVTGTATERIGTTLLSAEDLGVKPGDVISYYARARDVGRGKRPTQATSDIFFLEVKPFSEEFVSAQSQAGGQGGAQIDSLVEAQKQIIASTWNIERRSGAGRSAEDVRTVAQAQSTLKTRAEQMASRGSRRLGRVPAPQRSAAAAQFVPPPDPIATAVQAMEKAVQHLQTDRTKEALPHEMAALNGLLQAQAEVRRREIARQQANGGGNSGNRSGQDLSALFDKELQRQQQTNYETQPSVESREDRAEPNDGVLDRIRDLAKRQEDLSRRQNELAQAAPGAEELRRQLEKLVREQTELREQAEALARRLGSEGHQSSSQNGASASSGASSGRSPADQQGGQSLRDAAEQMRAAANDLSRDDAGAAARSGARAAEQLRRVEEQTRRNATGANERAAAGLQLEGQQIAQEQHRIAAEAERLDRNTGATTDARTRLSNEKDRLAQRVDELRRAAARDGAGTRNGVTRELEAIAERMRDSAKDMRGAAGRSGTARGEQEIARALDRVAGQLDTGVSPEARQLSAELDQIHAMRNRIQQLEQQMRDAAARQGSAPANSRSSGRGGQPAGGDRDGRGGTTQTAEAQRLLQEYRSEIDRARRALDQLAGSQSSGGSAGGAPVEEQFSRSAPGTEAFKQDRSQWESLRKDLDLALDRYEATVSNKLTQKAAADRFSAGGSDRVPDGYQQRIASYFESLASGKVKK